MLYEVITYTAAFWVYVEDHHLNLITNLYDLIGMNVLVGPIHLRYMHQALDALLDLDEGAVLGKIGDGAEQARTLRIAPRQIGPRILAQLLETERYAIALAVVAQHPSFDLITHIDDLGRVFHTLPCEVCDVQQTVNAAKIHESAVVGDILDYALDDSYNFV